MGAASSSPLADAFAAQYEALPDDVHDQIEALCAKDDMRLLKPHPAAPPPFPPLLVGVTVRLSQEVASAALATVPRLQRKHYEMIPRSLTELEFFLSFFSHVSAIVAQNCPGALDPSVAEGEGSWRGVDQADGTNSFDAAWQALSAERRAHLAELAGRDSDALLQPNPRAPPAFPPLPLGMQCFVDENAATAALAAIPGLQYKHYMLVPKKIDEKTFWVNTFSHITAALAEE